MIGAEEHLILGDLACKIKIFIRLKFVLMDCLSHLFFLVHGRVPLGFFNQILCVSLSESSEYVCFNRNYIILEIIIKLAESYFSQRRYKQSSGIFEVGKIETKGH